MRDDVRIASSRPFSAHSMCEYVAWKETTKNKVDPSISCIIHSIEAVRWKARVCLVLPCNFCYTIELGTNNMRFQEYRKIRLMFFASK